MNKKDWDQLKSEALEALAARAQELSESLWKLRLQKSTGQLENPSRLRTIRRDIARIKTLARAAEVKA
jgi:large subunit ribosomal protein L29